jgi:hypothetical protein
VPYFLTEKRSEAKRPTERGRASKTQKLIHITLPSLRSVLLVDQDAIKRDHRLSPLLSCFVMQKVVVLLKKPFLVRVSPTRARRVKTEARLRSGFVRVSVRPPRVYTWMVAP